MNNNSNAFFKIEDLGGMCKVEINGSSKDLINMLANIIEQDSRIKQLIELAIISVEFSNSEKQEQSEEEALMAMLQQMKIGLS